MSDRAPPWGFYGREQPFASLRDELLRDDWVFAALRGRRRVGKTELVRRVLDDVRRVQPERPILYVQMVEECTVCPGISRRSGAVLESEGYVCRDIADFAAMLGVESHQDV